MESKTFNPYLVTAALECAKNNPDGFTISPDMTEMPESGYAVAVETGDSTGTVGFLRALAWAIKHGLHFGGWLDAQTGLTHWDAVKVFPMGQLKEAAQYAKQERQIAFYDIANGVEIRL